MVVTLPGDVRIVDSRIIEDLRQAPGCGRDVREWHLWQDGEITEVPYRAADDANVGQAMLARVPVLEAERAEREARAAERLAAEQRQADAIRRLDAQDVADVLMVSVDEAVERGARTEVRR